MENATNDVLNAAALALEGDAGCRPERALALAKAVSQAAANEALEVVAGQTQAFGGAVDRRVGMLDRVIRALDAKERLPTIYEVGVIFRITPTQARNVLRTYEARFAEPYRGRLQAALQTVKPTSQQRGKVGVFLFDFDDPTVLEYAVDRLRRRGLTRSVSADWTKLQLVVDRSEKDRFDKTADEALKGN
jgi:hypothetical protein